MKKYLFAIDPGTTESGVCIVRIDDYKPMASAKIPNEKVTSWYLNYYADHNLRSFDFEIAIERVQGNGQPVGSEVFVTCEWIGRFYQSLKSLSNFDESRCFVYRREEYKFLCGNIYSHNDAGVRNALADRFAYGQPNFGKGNSKNPGWFYGFSKDAWSAYAVAVTWIDKYGLEDGVLVRVPMPKEDIE